MFQRAERNSRDTVGHDRLDPGRLQSMLERAFASPRPDDRSVAGVERRGEGDRRENRIRALAVRIGKGVGAATIFLWLAYTPVRSLLAPVSVEAVVNARLVTVRAPIDGVLFPDPNLLRLGAIAPAGETLLRVKNLRADARQLENIQEAINRLQNERLTIGVRLAAAQEAKRRAREQTDAFRAGRKRELDARLNEVKANIAAAQARVAQSEDLAKRLKGLAARKYASKIELVQATTNLLLAKAAEAAATHQAEAIGVERDAISDGAFIGDAYNDRPSSLQRWEELSQRVGDLESDLKANDAQLTMLVANAEVEKSKYSLNSETPVSIPSRARVFELLASPGEEVHRGQEIARLIDCDELLITATVSETVFNRLLPDGKATIRLKGENFDRPGKIVSLNGAGGIGAAMAIQPSTSQRENYRVTVSTSKLSEASTCVVGRTGQVLF